MTEKSYVTPARGVPGRWLAMVWTSEGEPAAILEPGRKNSLYDTPEDAQAAIERHRRRPPPLDEPSDWMDEIPADVHDRLQRALFGEPDDDCTQATIERHLAAAREAANRDVQKAKGEGS